MEIATYQRDQDSDRLFTRSKLDKKHARSRNDKVVTVHRYDGISFIFISLCFREYTTNILTSTTDLLAGNAILFFGKCKHWYVKYFYRGKCL